MKISLVKQSIGSALALLLLGCASRTDSMQATLPATLKTPESTSTVALTAAPTLEAHRVLDTGIGADIGDMAWSPDGTMLALCGEGEIAGVWDVQTLTPIHLLEARETFHCRAEFSPDGRWLAMSRGNASAEKAPLSKLWRVETWESIDLPRLWDFVWSLDSSLLAYNPAGFEYETTTPLHFYAVPDTGVESPEPLSIPAEHIEDMVWLPDGTIIALMWEEWESGGFTVARNAVWRSDDPEALDVWEPDDLRQGPYSSVILNHSGTVMAGMGGEGRVNLLELESHQHIRQFEFRFGIACMEFSVGNTLLAVGGERNVTVWDVETGGLVATLGGYYVNGYAGQWPSNLDFSPDGQTLAMIEWDGRLHLWSLPAYSMPPATPTPIPTLTPLPPFNLPEPAVYNIPFSDPDSSSITLSEVYWQDATTLHFRKIEWDVDSQLTAPEMVEFDTRTGEVISTRTVDQAIFGFANEVSPDKSRLAVLDNTEVRIYDAATYELLLKTTHQPFSRGNELIWSPDSTRIAVENYGADQLDIYDALTGEFLGALELGYDGPPKWSPNGRWIAVATGDYESQVKVWDTTTYEVVYEFIRSEDDPITEEYGIVEQVGWSPDGTRLLMMRWGWADILDMASGAIVQSTSFSVEGEQVFTYGPPTWSTDGEYAVIPGDLVWINSNPNVLVGWNTLTGEQSILIDYPAQFNDEDVYWAPFAWSPSRPVLATADWEGTLYLVDTRTMSGLTLRGLFNTASKQWDLFPEYLGWSPDGSRLVAIGPDGTVLVWVFDP